MYKIPHFTETDQAAIAAFIQAHPFAMLTGHDGSRNVATHVPLLIGERHGKIVVRGHLMRKTDHHLAFEGNPDLLLLFTGPHCYVSSSWYTEKGGATWNYQSVHARGVIRFLDEEATIGILAELTAKYELPQENPLLIEDMPEGYVATYVKAIVGFEIELQQIDAVFKLSQNKDDESYKNIVRHLLAGTDTDAHKVANEMIARRRDLFAGDKK